MNEPLRILICAGEVSGDMHAAALIRALRERLPRPIVFRGFGGDAMRAEGAELLYHTDRIAIWASPRSSRTCRSCSAWPSA